VHALAEGGGRGMQHDDGVVGVNAVGAGGTVEQGVVAVVLAAAADDDDDDVVVVVVGVVEEEVAVGVGILGFAEVEVIAAGAVGISRDLMEATTSLRAAPAPAPSAQSAVSMLAAAAAAAAACP
jgi:hypothetical protein